MTVLALSAVRTSRDVVTIQHQEQLKTLGDALSITTVVATLASWLPPLAALATLVWTLIRIYETKTVQGWLARRRARE